MAEPAYQALLRKCTEKTVVYSELVTYVHHIIIHLSLLKKKLIDY